MSSYVEPVGAQIKMRIFGLKDQQTKYLVQKRTAFFPSLSSTELIAKTKQLRFPSYYNYEVVDFMAANLARKIHGIVSSRLSRAAEPAARDLVQSSEVAFTSAKLNKEKPTWQNKKILAAVRTNST